MLKTNYLYYAKDKKLNKGKVYKKILKESACFDDSEKRRIIKKGIILGQKIYIIERVGDGYFFCYTKKK